MERSRRSGDAETRQTVIFLHIPKTAGTTFNHILRKVYGVGFLRIPPLRWQKTRRLAGGVSIVTGHMPYGVHERWGVEARYVTFLRDPVERIISLWWHIKKHTNHKRHGLARHMDVAEFAQSQAFAELDNGMVRWLTGGLAVGIAQKKRCVTEEDYRRALNHCSQMLIGTTETFSADVQRFANQLGWGKVPKYARKMVGKGRPPAKACQYTEIDAIRGANQWDCLLYETMK